MGIFSGKPKPEDLRWYQVGQEEGQEMTVNVDLLRKVKQQIVDHPESHDQAVWAEKRSCGTVCCVAGWAAHLSGGRLDWQVYGGATVEDVEAEAYEVEVGDGQVLTVREAAQLQLGLDDRDADYLFSSSRTQDEIFHFIDGRIEGNA